MRPSRQFCRCDTMVYLSCQFTGVLTSRQPMGTQQSQACICMPNHVRIRRQCKPAVRFQFALPSSMSACQLAVHLCEVFDLLFSKVRMYVCDIWPLAVLCLFMMDGTLQSRAEWQHCDELSAISLSFTTVSPYRLRRLVCYDFCKILSSSKTMPKNLLQMVQKCSQIVVIGLQESCNEINDEWYFVVTPS